MVSHVVSSVVFYIDLSVEIARLNLIREKGMPFKTGS